MSSVRAATGRNVDQATAPHDRDAVGAGADIGELVGDHHHRPPVVREAAHQPVKPRRLGRREHRRRLVEDDQPGVEVEDLGELDELPLADREIPDQRPRVDVGGERAEFFRHRLVLRGGAPRPGMRPGNEQVLDDAQRREQAELLEHHADAERHRIARRGDGHLPAVDQDRARVGRDKAVDELHQRRFAGAVLAEERQHLAFRDVQADRVVGDEIAVAFAQALEADERCGGHDFSRKTASTSTAAQRGRLATPIAVRQCSP